MIGAPGGGGGMAMAEDRRNGLAPAQGRGPDAAPLSNPRPVRIDDEGRVFERDGTRFRCPGLEPEAVRAGLADLEAGRVRPLSEVLAGRGR